MGHPALPDPPYCRRGPWIGCRWKGSALGAAAAACGTAIKGIAYKFWGGRLYLGPPRGQGLSTGKPTIKPSQLSNLDLEDAA